MSSHAPNGPQMFTAAESTSINGGTFQSANQIVNLHNPGLRTFQRGLDILEKRITPGAFHNSAERFDPPKCYPNTREAILKKIEAWVKERPDNGERLILWMYGPAGAGKSAIAQSIAELCEALLAASFFFSRTAAGRNDNSRFVATIAWQLIQAIPEIRETVLSSLELDPTILSRTPAVQMQSLIVDPLNQVPTELLGKRPHLVIIDGLDECLPPESQDNILEFLSTSLKRLNTPLYFLITSRPHKNIQDIFISQSFRSITSTLALYNNYQSRKDIHHFLTSSFGHIRSKHSYLPSPWPKTRDIEVLVQKSSGQFIYAATVIRYIERGRHGQEKRLETVLQLGSPDDSATPFAAIDALYLQIFESVGKEVIGNVMEVLGVLISRPHNDVLQGTPEAIEGFFNYRPGELLSIMEDVLALVHVPNVRDGVVKVYHASLPDFLVDPTRSRSFFLDRETVNLHLARHCIKNSVHNFPRDIHRVNEYQYANMFLESILANFTSKEMAEFLLEFSIWDCIPARPEALLQFRIGVATERYLQKFKLKHIQIYEAQLRFLDKWVYKALLSVPQDIRHMVLISIAIYFKEKPPALGFLLEELLGVTRPVRSFDLILRRIYVVFSLELPQTSSHYTEFAIWLAKNLAGIRRGPRYPDVYYESFGRYLVASLMHCQESQVLVDLLKCDAHTTLSSSGARNPEALHLIINNHISQYIERCERFFDAQAKEHDSAATESPPVADTPHSRLSIDEPDPEIRVEVEPQLIFPTAVSSDLSVEKCPEEDVRVADPVESISPQVTVDDKPARDTFISERLPGISFMLHAALILLAILISIILRPSLVDYLYHE